MKMRFVDGMDAEIRRILYAQIRNLWTHSSTAIEGNSLTLGETVFVLDEGLTIAGKPLKDHQQVHGHAQAIEAIYRLLDEPDFDEGHVFMLHRALLAERLADIDHPAGAWKREPNYGTYIGPDGRQASREYPGPRMVPLLMQQWLRRLNDSTGDMAACDAARAYAERHLEFVTIHPFADANGRLARLLANIPLLRSGHPPIVIPTAAKREYIRRLSEYQETVADLPGLRDLGQLPANAERDAFVAFCAAQWEETLSLVREARAMQEKLDAGRISGAGYRDKGTAPD